MNDFEYIRAASVEEALEGLGRVEGARLMAGGTDLIPLVKDEIVSPGAVVDLSGWKEGARIELGYRQGHYLYRSRQFCRRSWHWTAHPRQGTPFRRFRTQRCPSHSS